MRRGSVQCTPSVDEMITRSFVAQLGSKRQSDHTTYTLPALSISAVGRGPARIPPGSTIARICAASTTRLQLFPPSVERKDSIAVRKQSPIGTITVPLG